MKISISVKGRFHAFFLANELQKAGLLNQLITPYPVFKTCEYGIDKTFVDSLLLNELVERGIRQLPFQFVKTDRANYLFNKLFDMRAGRKIKTNSDIFVGWSEGCLETMKKIRGRPIKLIVENGSTHAIFQKEIMEEEFELHGLSFQADKRMISKKLEEYSFADYISIPSQFTKNTFLKYPALKNKIICIPYGVDAEKFYPIKNATNDKIFRIIICGNIGLRKGIQYLLKAFYELKLPNSELYVIGPVSAELKSIIEKYKASNIIWAGCFNENKLVHEYAKGSVFCLPSIEEGLALVIPQAMSCGLPIICTTNTGGGDIISEGEEGFIIPIRDADAIKQKILFLYENAETRIEMGKQARNTILNNFTWSHYGQKIIAAYRDILKSSSAP